MGANTQFVVVCVLQNLQTKNSYIYTYIHGYPSLCGLCGIEFKANNQLDIHVHTKHGSIHPICVVCVVQNLQTTTSKTYTFRLSKGAGTYFTGVCVEKNLQTRIS